VSPLILVILLWTSGRGTWITGHLSRERNKKEKEKKKEKLRKQQKAPHIN